jgi:hypothetical protein
MATLEQLSTALRNADKAGDVAAARMLAGEIRKMQSAPAPAANSTPSGRHLTYEEGLAEMEKERQDTALGAAGAAGTSFFEDMPIVGPAILGAAQRAAAGLGSLIDGESYDENLNQAQTATKAAQEANPVASMAGGVAGNVAALAPLGATSVGARALGITGPNLATRAIASGASSGLLSAADTAVRGGDAGDAAWNGGISAGIGAAIPLVGAGVNAGIRAVSDKIYPTVNALRNPTDEASRRVGTALARDTAIDPASVITQADEAVARNTSVPLMNVDRGGETTRALARSVANQSPEARGMIEKAASDRFGGQSQRASQFIAGLSGGADDIALQTATRNAAVLRNRAAYGAAEATPEAQAIFTPGIQDLMQAPSFRAAIKDVPKKSADRGAVQGFKEIKMPFAETPDGDYVLKQAADGSIAAPNLQFWNQVKINLDGEISKAKVAGDRSTASDLRGLKEKLLEELDVVPGYADARMGAFKAFQAEDAIDAGKKFATTPRLIPEAKEAFKKMSQKEKDGFATGFASELIDKMKATGDRTNVINGTFKNQAFREQAELVFGPQKAKEIEAYVRVEDLADRIRGAMGNSTTARQLVELGLGGGVGGGLGYLTGGDLQSASSGAVLGAGLASARAGSRYLGERADAKAMEQIAKLLVQDNPLALRSAVTRAAKNPSYMRALEQMSNGLALPSRAIALEANQ